MTFARGNSLNWGFNEKYTSAQLNATDVQWPDALDGGAGGTYAPSAVIHLGGSGMDFTVPITGTHLDLSAGLHVSAATTTLDGAFVVNGTSIFNSTGQFLDDWRFAGGGTFLFDAGSTFSVAAGGFFTVACTLADFSGATVQTDDVTVANSIVINGTAIVTSTNKLEVNDGATLELSGGATLNRVKVTLNNANQNIVVADGHSFKTPGLSSNRTYTLKRTGASDGDEIEIYATNTSNDGIVQNEAGTTLATLQYGTGGKSLYVRCNYSTAITDWEVIDHTVQ